MESVILFGATELESLTAFEGAASLRELSIDGPRTLDLTAVAHIKRLRVLRLDGIRELRGTAALATATGLRELTLSAVTSIDSMDALRALRGVKVVIDGDELMSPGAA
ncbi:hypothetical protein [Microbacterium sp.]|uniref:hypothetical protein n=1 Tax=Microbacterium sp. TaxID=51671 RepID=UPI0039E4519F